MLVKKCQVILSFLILDAFSSLGVSYPFNFLWFTLSWVAAGKGSKFAWLIDGSGNYLGRVIAPCLTDGNFKNRRNFSEDSNFFCDKEMKLQVDFETFSKMISQEMKKAKKNSHIIIYLLSICMICIQIYPVQNHCWNFEEWKLETSTTSSD